jgi:hypothetical protein
MAPEAEDRAASLLAAVRAVRAAVLDAPLLPAERTYLASTAARIEAMVERLRAAEAEPPAERPSRRRGEVFYTRSEAARLLQVAGNTLLAWESKGLLVPRRDSRGWRVYGRDDLARALALAAHVPVDDLAGHGRRR